MKIEQHSQEIVQHFTTLNVSKKNSHHLSKSLFSHSKPITTSPTQHRFSVFLHPLCSNLLSIFSLLLRAPVPVICPWRSFILWFGSSWVSILSQRSTYFLKCSITERRTHLFCEEINRHIIDVVRTVTVLGPNLLIASFHLVAGFTGTQHLHNWLVYNLPTEKKRNSKTNHCNTTDGQQPSCQKTYRITQPVLKPEELSNHQPTRHKQNPSPPPSTLRRCLDTTILVRIWVCSHFSHIYSARATAAAKYPRKTRYLRYLWMVVFNLLACLLLYLAQLAESGMNESFY